MSINQKPNQHISSLWMARTCVTKIGKYTKNCVTKIAGSYLRDKHCKIRQQVYGFKVMQTFFDGIGKTRPTPSEEWGRRETPFCCLIAEVQSPLFSQKVGRNGGTNSPRDPTIWSLPTPPPPDRLRLYFFVLHVGRMVIDLSQRLFQSCNPN